MLSNTDCYNLITPRKNAFFVFAFFIMLFYVLNTVLELASIRISLAYLVLTAGFLLAFIKYPFSTFKALNHNGILIYFCFIFLIILYASVVEVVSGYSGGQFYFSIIIINVFACSIFSIVFSVILIKKNFTIYNIFQIFFFIGVLNSIIIVISFFIPEVRLFIESLLYQQEGSNIDYMNIDWRLRGIAAAGGASLSVFLAFSVVCGVICNKEKLLSSNFFLLCSSIILLAQFFVARTGLILSLIVFSIWFAVELFKFRPRFYLVLSVFSTLLTLFFIAFYEELSTILPFALEIFYNFFSGEGLETGSTNELIEMLVFPSDPLYLSFGFGCFEGCQIYRSDSGYLKTVSAIGLLLSLVIYFVAFYFFVFKVANLISAGKCYWFLFVVLLFISEVKEPFIYQNYLARALIFLVCFYYVRKVALREFHANLSHNFKSGCRRRRSIA